MGRRTPWPGRPPRCAPLAEPGAPDNLVAWLALLDGFERALDAAEEQMLVQEFAAPPGPPPAELLDRARATLARQQLMIDGLRVSRANVARELAALRRVPAPGDGSPAFLDLEG